MPRISKPLCRSSLTWIADSEERTAAGARKALFKCTCGKEKLIIITKVNSGQTQTCGCGQKKQKQAFSSRLFKESQKQ